MKNIKEILVLGVAMSTLVLVLVTYIHTSNTGKNLFNKGVDELGYQSKSLGDIRFQNFIGSNVQGSNIIYMVKNYNYKVRVQTYTSEFTVGYDSDDEDATKVTGPEGTPDRLITYKDLEDTESPYYVVPTALFYGSVEYTSDGEVDYFSFRQKGVNRSGSSGGDLTVPESEKKEGSILTEFNTLTDNSYVKVDNMLKYDNGTLSTTWGDESATNKVGIKTLLELCKEKDIYCDVIFDRVNEEPLFFAETDLPNDVHNFDTLTGSWGVYRDALNSMNPDSTFQVSVQKGTNQNLVVTYKELIEWPALRDILAQYCAIETVKTTDAAGVETESKEIRKVLVQGTKLKKDISLLAEYWEGTISYLNDLKEEDIVSNGIYMVQMSTPKNLYKGVFKIMKPDIKIDLSTSKEDCIYTKTELITLLTDVCFVNNSPLLGYTTSNTPDYDTSTEGAEKIFNLCAEKSGRISIAVKQKTGDEIEFNSTTPQTWKEWSNDNLNTGDNYYIRRVILGTNSRQVTKVYITEK